MALSDNVVAAYKFNNGALTTDTVGSYTLTNNNTVANTNDGKPAYCADAGTSNTNKWLSVATDFGMLGSSAKTFSFWGKVRTAPGSGVKMMFFRHLYGGSAVGNYVNLGYRNNGGTFELIMDSSPTTETIAQTLTVDTWYHFIITVPANNTGNITCYMNGSSLFTVANWSQNYALTTTLGIFADNGGADFGSMMVDEFYLWSRVLSGAEITQLYNGGVNNPYPFVTTYTLDLAQGAYTLTGVATAFNRVIKLLLAQGSYTYTGFQAVIGQGYQILCSMGSYTYTGITQTLYSIRRLVLAAGSYTYTGYATAFQLMRRLLATTGSYVYTGFEALVYRKSWDQITKNTNTFSNINKNTSDTWVDVTKQ